MSTTSAKALILERFPFLTPKLQAAARFVVDHPNEAVTLSMRSLAEHARLQPATLVRLAQQLGFAGWAELKEAFIADLGLDSRRYAARARSLSGRARDASLVEEIFKAQRANLEATEAAAAGSLRDAARLLRRARTVHIAAFRASYAVAYSLAYGYRLFRDSVALIDGHAGGVEMQTLAIQPQDAVVVFGFVPYSRETIQVAEVARAAGARLVAFSDSNASPLALAADVSIVFSLESPSYFPSLCAAMAVCEALLEILVAEGDEQAARRLDTAEQRLIDSGAYVQ